MFSIALQFESKEAPSGNLRAGDYDGQVILASAPHEKMGAAIMEMSKMYKQDGATLEANPVSKLLPVPGILRPIQYMNALIFTYECKTAAECIRLLDTFDMTKKAASARTNALDIMCEPRWFIRRDKKTIVYLWNDTTASMDIMASKATAFAAAIQSA